MGDLSPDTLQSLGQSWQGEVLPGHLLVCKSKIMPQCSNQSSEMLQVSAFKCQTDLPVAMAFGALQKPMISKMPALFTTDRPRCASKRL